MVGKIVERNVGKIISLGFNDCKFALKPIIVVGNNCSPIAFITSSISIANLVFGKSLSIRRIASIPLGVLAFPSPSRFQDKFIATYFI